MDDLHSWSVHLLASKGCESGLDSKGQPYSRPSVERGYSEHPQRILGTGVQLSLGEGEP